MLYINFALFVITSIFPRSILQPGLEYRRHWLRSLMRRDSIITNIWTWYVYNRLLYILIEVLGIVSLKASAREGTMHFLCIYRYILVNIILISITTASQYEKIKLTCLFVSFFGLGVGTWFLMLLEVTVIVNLKPSAAAREGSAFSMVWASMMRSQTDIFTSRMFYLCKRILTHLSAY